MNNLNELYEAILAGKLEQAVSVTREAVAGGAAPQEIINEYMIKAMEEKNDGKFDYSGANDRTTWAK